jgi:hypothetical protein
MLIFLRGMKRLDLFEPTRSDHNYRYEFEQYAEILHELVKERLITSICLIMGRRR